MKKLSAVAFRNILAILLLLAIALIVSVFIFGYRHLQSVEEDTRTRQAEATASNDTINRLQQLEIELEQRSEVIEKLKTLRSSNSLPQFDTEHSLRTITQQLGLPIRNVVFVSAEDGSPEAAAQASWGGGPNSRVSFEFSRAVSYGELLRFLHAIETSTPKLRLHGLSLPAESNRNSINPGILILEMATQ